MITLVTELTTKQGVAMTDLHAYLRGGFSEQAVVHGGSARLQKFVLSLRLPDADIDSFAEARGWSAAPDAILQFSFLTAEDAAAAMTAADDHLLSSPELLALVAEDRLSTFAAEERVVFETMSPQQRWARVAGVDLPVKMVVQNWKRPDLSFEKFSRHWHDVHGALVSQHGPAMGYRRYVQSQLTTDQQLAGVTKRASRRTFPDGGMAEVWWTNRSVMKQELASPAGLAASAAMEVDEVNFVNPPLLTAFLATELLVVGQP